VSPRRRAEAGAEAGEQLLNAALIFGDPDYVTAKIRRQQEKEGFNSPSAGSTSAASSTRR